MTNDYLEELSKLFGGIIKPELTSGFNFATDRFSNEKITWHNGKYEGNYYPSMETHEEAFFNLLLGCRFQRLYLKYFVVKIVKIDFVFLINYFSYFIC